MGNKQVLEDALINCLWFPALTLLSRQMNKLALQILLFKHHYISLDNITGNYKILIFNSCSNMEPKLNFHFLSTSADGLGGSLAGSHPYPGVTFSYLSVQKSLGSLEPINTRSASQPDSNSLSTCWAFPSAGCYCKHTHFFFSFIVPLPAPVYYLLDQTVSL